MKLNNPDAKVYAPWQHCQHPDCDCHAYQYHPHDGQQYLRVAISRDIATDIGADACGVDVLSPNEALARATAEGAAGVAVECDDGTAYYVPPTT